MGCGASKSKDTRTQSNAHSGAGPAAQHGKENTPPKDGQSEESETAKVTATTTATEPEKDDNTKESTEEPVEDVLVGKLARAIDLAKVRPFSCRHVRAALKGKPKIEQAFTAPLQGAILFADMSGFTPLTRRLCDKGPQGVEELSLHLNEFFSQMIAITHDFSGDIIKFAGDALLILFPSADDSADALVAATASGARCGLKLIEVLNGFSPIPGIVLKLHCALTAGDLIDVNVGGFEGQYEHFLSGEPISVQLASCMDTAGHGEIAASPEASKLLAPFSKLKVVEEPLREGLTLIESVNTVDDGAPAQIPVEDDSGVTGTQVEQFVPSYVLDRLRGQNASQLAEMRQVTVIFCKLREHNMLDPEDAKKFMDAVYTIQRIVVQHQGAVRQIITDDKGTVILLMFGLQAGVDSPRWATHAALKIRQEVAKPVAIGLTTSKKVFCGSVGDAMERCEFAVVGDSVNMAARLMCKVPDFDGVLCDDLTQESVSGSRKADIDFDHFGDINVKGREDTIRVFKPSIKEAGSEEEEKVVISGRDREVELLSDRYLKDGYTPKEGVPAPVVTIVAPAGLGKSALTRHFIELCQESGFSIFTGLSDLIERFTPYFCWGPMLSLVIKAHHKQGRSHEQTLCDLLDNRDEIPLLSGLIPDITIPDNAVTASLSGGARSYSTMCVVRDLLLAHMKVFPKTLLIIEDMQWADVNSMKLYRFIRAEIPYLPFLLNTRPVPPDHPMLSWYGEPPAEDLSAVGTEDMLWICIKPFDVSGVRDQIANIFGLDRNDELDDLSAIVHDVTNGVPLFTTEISLALESRELISVSHGKLGFMVSREEIEKRAQGFSSVQDVMAERFDTLDMICQQVLKTASAIGFQFDYQVLSNLLRGSAGVASAVSTLLDEGYVNLNGDLAYVFNHIIIAQVAYGRVVHTHRAALHRNIARYLEETNPGTTVPRIHNSIAQHWTKCAETERAGAMKIEAAIIAIGWLQKAAKSALTQNTAIQSAITMLDQASELLDILVDDPRHYELKLTLLSEQGPTAFMSGGFMKGRPVYAAGLELIESVDDPKSLYRNVSDFEQARFKIFIGYWLAHIGTGTSEEIISTAERCWDVAHQSKNDDFIVEAAHALWTAYLIVGTPMDMPKVPSVLLEGVTRYSIVPHNHNCFQYMAHDPFACGLALGVGPALLAGNLDLVCESTVCSQKLSHVTGHPGTIVHSYMHSLTLYLLAGFHKDVGLVSEANVGAALKYDIKAHAKMMQLCIRVAEYFDGADERSAEENAKLVKEAYDENYIIHTKFLGLGFVSVFAPLRLAEHARDYATIEQIYDDMDSRDFKRGLCVYRQEVDRQRAHASLFRAEEADQADKDTHYEKALEVLETSYATLKDGINTFLQIRLLTSKLTILLSMKAASSELYNEETMKQVGETLQKLHDHALTLGENLENFEVYYEAREALARAGIISESPTGEIIRSVHDHNPALRTRDWEDGRALVTDQVRKLQARLEALAEE